MSEAISFSSSWVCGKKRCLTSMSAAIVVAVLFGAERPCVFAHATHVRTHFTRANCVLICMLICVVTHPAIIARYATLYLAFAEPGVAPAVLGLCPGFVPGCRVCRDG